MKITRIQSSLFLSNQIHAPQVSLHTVLCISLVCLLIYICILLLTHFFVCLSIYVVMLSMCFLLSYFLFVLKILNHTKQLTPPTYEKTRSYLNKRFQSLENILVMKRRFKPRQTFPIRTHFQSQIYVFTLWRTFLKLDERSGPEETCQPTGKRFHSRGPISRPK